MAYEGWEDGAPPLVWPRYLAYDVGGASANVMEWAAQDPVSLSLVYYDEVHKITTDMRLLADLALPKMKNSGGEEYTFAARAGDYENRIALDDMAKFGIRFDNAGKQNKLLSVRRLSGYLHPNPKRPFPAWHPDAGKMGAPLMFIMPACKHLIEEIPIQKWKEDRSSDEHKDELDRNVKHDAVDCSLYISRIVPAPAMVAIVEVKLNKTNAKSRQSMAYWEDVRRLEKNKSAGESRKKYSISHEEAEKWKSLLS